MRALLISLAAVAMIATACGDSDTAELPINDGGGAAGTCLEGTPDCNDTPAPGDDLPILPGEDDGDGGLVPVGGMVVDGGLTVTDALAGDATGVIAVKGFVFDDGSGMRLCETLAESFPPQCGGPSIAVEGLALADVQEYATDEEPVLNTEQGVSWTDQHVTLLGELVGDVLTIATDSI